MELKDIDELKELWLSAHPDSSHANDLKRFIRYAVELDRVNGTLDHAKWKAGASAVGVQRNINVSTNF